MLAGKPAYAVSGPDHLLLAKVTLSVKLDRVARLVEFLVRRRSLRTVVSSTLRVLSTWEKRSL